jgi:hypothetical protein
VIYLLSLIYWWVELSGKIASLSDPCLDVFPEKKVIAQSIHLGLVPLWNPYITCGSPLLANWQSGCFYPLVILGAVFDSFDYFPWFTISHQIFYFFGFYLWLRKKGIDNFWCVLGSISYASSGRVKFKGVKGSGRNMVFVQDTISLL